MNVFKELLALCVLGLFFSGFSHASQDIITTRDVKGIRASSEGSENKAVFAMDGDMATRWESLHGIDPVWIEIGLKEEKLISSVKISWETAAAQKYKIQVSKDGKTWMDTASVEDGRPGEDRIIKFAPVKTKFIRIHATRRATEWGYSIREIVFNPEEAVLEAFNPQHPYNNPKLSIDERLADLLSRMSIREKISLLSGAEYFLTRGVKRLHIPAVRMSDGPHGVGSGSKSTCFPAGISMAACWDEELIYDVGVALGKETRAEGKHILLGPCVGIHRTPLGGRNFESFSEDPYLAARIAAAYVKGVQSQRIGTSTKHYAVNNQERERFTISSEVDGRTMREIYLPAFKAAVTEAETLTVMAAYNKFNGIYCAENARLLKDILKNEWGFKGFVVSDWGAVHSVADTVNAGCDLEMPGPGKFLTETNLLLALENGEITEDVINENAGRILRAVFWLGLFDDPDPRYEAAIDTPEHRKLARELAENAICLLKNDGKSLPLDMAKIKTIAVIGPNAKDARLGGGGSSTVNPFYSVSPLEGIKNKCADKVVVHYIEGCSLMGDLKDIPVEYLSPAGSKKGEYGLKGEYFNNRDFTGQPVLTRIDGNINFNWGDDAPSPEIETDIFSVRWSGNLTVPESKEYALGLSSDDGSRLYIDNKLIVDNWGEHAEITVKKSVYLQAGRSYNIRIEYYEAGGGAVMKFGQELPAGLLFEEAVKIAKAADVVVVFAGLNNQIEGEGVDKYDLELPGQQNELIKTVAAANKNTVVVLINGTPVLMDKWIDKVPAVVEAWYPGQEGGHAIANVLFGEINPSGKMPCTFPKRYEDDASGQNYPGKDGKVYYEERIFFGYRHFDKKNIEPLFAFGHGLSYTEFEYSNLRIESKDNISSYPVKVSLDLKNIGRRQGKEVVQLYVRDVKSTLERPKKELKAFKKVSLMPGEQKKVSFELGKEALAFYNPVDGGWMVEPGEFNILIGSSSGDIRLEDRFNLTKGK